MQRRTKRHRKTSGTNATKRALPPRGFAAWLASTSRPGTDLSLLLAKVRAAQIRRMHFR
jgi:hypothetical protein